MQLLIRTSRLEIKPLAEESLEAARILHNDPETLRWLSDTREISQSDQVNWFKELQTSKSSIRLAVRLLKSNDLVGVFRIDQLDLLNKSANVGLDISLPHRRLGYAKETYLGMLEYFFRELKLNRLALITLATNIAAIKLYEELGFSREGILRQAFIRDSLFVDAYQYALLKSEFLN